MALTGWEPLLDRYTIYRIGRRAVPDRNERSARWPMT